MQTATNPETGETVVLVGGSWQKADRIASNEKGEKAFLIGGKWLTDSGVANLPTEKKRGLGTELVRQIGLTARAGVEGLTAPVNMIGDAFGLGSTEAVKQGLTKLGLPVPENGMERVSQDVAGALASMGGIAKVSQLASPTSTAGQAIASGLADNLGLQTGATTAASGAAGTTREMGGGPGSQLVAGLAGGVVAPMAGQAALNAVPNMIAKSVRKSDATPFAREGERLAQETGIDLTLGQRSGNRFALSMENAARQYAPTADRVQDIDVKIANQAIQRIETIADSISKSKQPPETLGFYIENTVKDAAKKLDQVRDSQAAKDYGLVRQLAGDKPVVQLKNFADELRTIVDEYKNVAGSDAQKISAQAAAALKRITGVVDDGKAPGLIQSVEGAPLNPGQSAQTGVVGNTITEAMRTRRFYGKASRGEGNVFDDIAPNLNRTLAARLFGAVNKDFDDSAANAGGALRDALNNANTNFKKSSQSLEYLEKSVLGKMVGEELSDAAVSGARVSTTAGEAIVQKLMKAHPSSRKTAIDILERWNPELAKDTRAFVLRDAMDQAMSIPPTSKGASQVPVSFNKFISALQGEKVGFNKQLKSYGFSDTEVKDIKDTVSAMMRAGDRTGFNFSNTNVQGRSMEVAEAVGQGMMGNIKGAASKALSIAGKTIGLNKFVDAMSSEEGRKALRTISSAKSTPQAVVAAFETIEQ